MYKKRKFTIFYGEKRAWRKERYTAAEPKGAHLQWSRGDRMSHKEPRSNEERDTEGGFRRWLKHHRDFILCQHTKCSVMKLEIIYMLSS